ELMTVARRRRVDEIEVADRFLERHEELCLIEDIGGARGRRARAFFRPAVTRCDEAQIRETEIRHGARAHADVLGKLRLDEDDRRAAFETRLPAVGAGAWHALASGKIDRVALEVGKPAMLERAGL